MKTEKDLAWQQLPALTLPSPVLALAGRGNDIWVGGLGGVARYPTSAEQGVWEPQVATLPLSSVTALLALDGVLLAGGSEGIAWSANDGATWQRANLEDGVVAVTAFAASPNFASDHTAVAATLANGIVRTTDGGRTWLNASFGLESMEVTTLIWEAEANILAAATDGIYRSRDAGRAWRRVYAGEDLDIEAFVSLPGGTMLAALVDGNLLHSQDGGKHWNVNNLPVPNVQASTLCAISNGTVLLGTFEHGLLRSGDEGATWQCVSAQVVYTCAQIDERIYIGTETGVSVSLDGCLTWTELPCPPIHDLRTLLVRDDHLLLMGTYAGIVRAEHTVGVSATGWEALGNVPSQLMACAFAPDNALFLSSPTGLVRLPLDEGHTVGVPGVPATEAGQVLVEGETGQVAYFAMRQSGMAWHIWAASADGSRLLHSADGGASWRQLPAPFGVLSVVALQAIPDRVFAATYDPRAYRVCVWHTTDDGKTWARSLEAGTMWPLVATCAQPPALSIGNTLLLERSPAQWQQVTVGSDGGGIRRILGVQLDEKIVLFVLTTTGMQRSEDMGETWQQDNAGLPADQIMDMAASSTTLYVLLSGGRVWQRPIS